MGDKTSGQQADQAGLVRLNKVLASSGVCSRRKADELIAQGKVRVNDRIVTALGTKVDPERDRISVADRPIGQVPGSSPREHIYLALNKPVRTITSLSDPQGRQTVWDLLPEKLKHRRILPVGRLDAMSEGLLLMTSHGELLHRLTHASWHVAKTYRVLVRGQVPPETMDRFRNGMVLQEGDQLAPVDIKHMESHGGRTWLEMTLYEGKNRQIRRMCRDTGLTVLRLLRIRQGPVNLGSLPPGGCRMLSDEEIRSLLLQTGLEGSKQPG